MGYAKYRPRHALLQTVSYLGDFSYLSHRAQPLAVNARANVYLRCACGKQSFFFALWKMLTADQKAV